MKYSSYKWHNKSFISLLFSSGRCFSRFSSYLLNGFQWHQPESQSDGANHHSIKIESMADGLLSASRSFHHKHDDVGVITESCTVYHRRWYILVVFSLIAGVQAAVWNTWGPITGSAEDVFGWSDGTIALLENWGPIAYIISFLVFSWLMDIKGSWFFLLKLVGVGDRILQDFAMNMRNNKSLRARFTALCARLHPLQ